jgi:hypothetical protein
MMKKSTMVNGKMEWKMAMDLWYIQMDTSIMVFGKRIRNMVKEPSHCMMEYNTKDNGLMEWEMVNLS